MTSPLVNVITLTGHSSCMCFVVIFALYVQESVLRVHFPLVISFFFYSYSPKTVNNQLFLPVPLTESISKKCSAWNKSLFTTVLPLYQEH